MACCPRGLLRLHRIQQHGGDEHLRTREHGSGLLTHTIAFVLVNAFPWIQDLAISSGLRYAYWVTIPWAVGLLGHATVVWRERGKERAPLR